MTTIRKVSLAFLSVFAGLTLWITIIEPASLRVRSHRLELPRWAAQDSGLRVAFLADLHVGSPLNGLGKVKRVVAETNAAHPDLVLLAGDFVIHNVPVGHFVPPEPTAAILRDLSAPLGI